MKSKLWLEMLKFKLKSSVLIMSQVFALAYNGTWRCTFWFKYLFIGRIWTYNNTMFNWYFHRKYFGAWPSEWKCIFTSHCDIQRYNIFLIVRLCKQNWRIEGSSNIHKVVCTIPWTISSRCCKSSLVILFFQKLSL